MADYLPKTDDALVAWFDNFQVKFIGYSTALGMVALQESVQADFGNLQYVVALADRYRAESKERTAYKQVMRDGPIGTPTPAPPTTAEVALGADPVAPGIVPRLRALVQRIKTHPSYTIAMGQDLGIIGPGSGDGDGDVSLLSDPLPRPENTVAVVLPDSEVRLKWVKKTFDGVLVESQRATETVWTQIGMDTSSPYLDSREPLVVGVPELRRYRLRYVKTDDPIGDYSDVITVTTVP
jgi:hypothetical protein